MAQITRLRRYDHVMDADLIHRHHTNGTITDREREALHLHHVKHLSYRQIAAGLGVGLSTVHDRIHRAHQKITLAERKTA